MDVPVPTRTSEPSDTARPLRQTITAAHTYYRSKGFIPSIDINPLIAAAASLFTHLSQFNTSGNTPTDLSALREELIHEIHAFETQAQASCYPSSIILASRYALCCLIDETIATLHHVPEWKLNTLLMHFHGEVHGGERFFLLLERGYEDPDLHIDFLELMYLCLSFGYQGKYRGDTDGHQHLARTIDDLFYCIRQQRTHAHKPLLSPAEKTSQANQSEYLSHWKRITSRYKRLPKLDAQEQLELNSLLKHWHLKPRRLKSTYYIISGAEGCGKNTLISHPELKLTHTPETHWWEGAHVAFLSVAAPTTFPVWQHFFKRLTRHNAKAVFKGVIWIIDLHAWQSPAKRIGDIALLKALLLALVNYPEYSLHILLSKSDKLLGFTEFFTQMDTKECQQLCGLSFNAHTRLMPETFHKKYDDFLKRLSTMTIPCLQSWRSNEHLHDIKLFPLQIAKLKDSLNLIANTINAVGPISLKGLYFISCQQTGETIDYLNAHKTETSTALVQRHKPQERTYFCQDLFSGLNCPQSTPSSSHAAHPIVLMGTTILSIVVLAGTLYISTHRPHTTIATASKQNAHSTRSVPEAITTLSSAPVKAPLFPTAALKQVVSEHTDGLSDSNQHVLSAFIASLNTIEKAGHPSQAAFKVAKQWFLTQANPMSAMQQALHTLPKEVSTPLQPLIAQSWHTLLEQATQYINQQWQQTIVLEYQAHLVNRYPINAQAASDISLAAFQAFFKPNGAIDQFTQHYIKPFIHTHEVYWTWKERYGETMPLSQTSLEIFIRATLIREMFFDRQGTLGISASLIPENDYLHDIINFQWPDTSPALFKRFQIPTTQSEWALFHWLDKVGLKPTDLPNHYLIAFKQKEGQEVRVELVTNRVINPFMPHVLTQFNCPKILD